MQKEIKLSKRYNGPESSLLIAGNGNDLMIWNVNFDKDIKVTYDSEAKEFNLRIKSDDPEFKIFQNDILVK